MKKLIIFLFVLVILSNFVSSFDWSNTIAYWNFDNSTNFSISLTGLRNWNQNGSLTAGSNCLNGNCSFLNGNSTDIYLNQSTFVNASLYGNGTLIIWFKVNELGNFDIAGRGVTGVTSAWQLAINSSGSFIPNIENTHPTSSTPFVTAGIFHNIIMTWDASNTYIYFDGFLHSTFFGLRPTSDGTGGDYFFRSNNPASQFKNLTIDESAFMNRTFTANDVREIWNGGSGLKYNSQIAFNSTQNITGLGNYTQNYNPNTYETLNETFSANISLQSGVTVSSASLVYGSTTYSGSITTQGNNVILSKSFDIPTSSVGINSFYWTITANSGTYNLTTRYQNVQNIIFQLCNSTVNIPYINFTFKDEVSLSNINGSFVSSLWSYWLGSGSVTKSLSYANSSYNPSYAFCLSPSFPTLNQDTIIQYSGNGYPQRRYFTTDDLTNTTTNQILYLLGTSDGIYSAIQVTNQIGSPIQGATVVIEKQISGVWTIIGSEETDGSGVVTFWVDPNSDHRITVTATGYSSTTQIIRPTQATYTVILATSAGNASFQSDLEGLTWLFRPGSGIVANGSAINFNVTISAAKSNLVSCQFRLINATSNISSTTSTCNSTGGFLSLTYTPKTNEKVWGLLYVDIGNGSFVLDGDAYWIAYPTNISQARTIKGILGSLAQLNEFGEGVEQEFSKIVVFFFLMSILLGLITYFSGYDFSNPGFAVTLLYGIILLASIAGWFQYEDLIKTSPIVSAGVQAWLNKYIYAVIMTFIFLGFLLNQIRRTQ